MKKGNNSRMYITYIVLITLGLKETLATTCARCKGTDNASCMSRANTCANGQFCASTFARSNTDAQEIMMVRKRCANKCDKPNQLECNQRQSKCTYCCSDDGCNETLFPIRQEGTDTAIAPTPPPDHIKYRVAFSAHSDSVEQGFGRHHVVRFPTIFTNIGNLFDGMSNLADLTIKHPGLYQFSVYVVTTNGGDAALLTLKHNGLALLHSKPYVSAETGHFILPTGSIHIVLQLEIGDSIQLSVERVTHDTRTSPSDVVFNGFLIS